MRSLVAFITLTFLICGCSNSGVPTLPDSNNPTPELKIANLYDGPYMLWWDGKIAIDESRENAIAIPDRAGRFHLNALKFLEDYCADCVEITSIKNNGDSTIDLTVRITHPFPGIPEYTGFDVKGIIMFDGSWENKGFSYYEPWPEWFRVSWRKLGNPQLLNADGFTTRWSPSYDSGKEEPIYNYWEGKYAKGTPTANLNGFLNFYTDEERHMFKSDGSVIRTYTIWMPPGEPVVAGYAVEACWVSPDVMPVTNPVEDFPVSANQPEPYEFKVVLNEGEVITEKCCTYTHDQIYFTLKQWGGVTVNYVAINADHEEIPGGGPAKPYGPEFPNDYGKNYLFVVTVDYPDGDWIAVGTAFRGELNPVGEFDQAYTVFEFTIDQD
jgi:hypothetical protein